MVTPKTPKTTAPVAKAASAAPKKAATPRQVVAKAADTVRKPRAPKAADAVPKAQAAKAARPEPLAAVAAMARQQAQAPVAVANPRPPVSPVVVPPLSVVSSEPARPPEPEVEVPSLKKRDLVKRVIDLSGAKKKDAKAIIDAVLTVMGEALSRGEEMVLPPFGKTKVNRQKVDAQGDMIIVKLRRGGKTDSGKQGLAEDDEDE